MEKCDNSNFGCLNFPLNLFFRGKLHFWLSLNFWLQCFCISEWLQGTVFYSCTKFKEKPLQIHLVLFIFIFNRFAHSIEGYREFKTISLVKIIWKHLIVLRSYHILLPQALPLVFLCSRISHFLLCLGN